MWIDVTVPLDGNPPRWPGSVGVTLDYANDLADGDKTRDTVLTMDVHCGTHVEVAAHVSLRGLPMDSVNLDHLMGLVAVLDATGHREVPKSLAGHIPQQVMGVLTRTDNSIKQLMGISDFEESFVGWSVEFAEAVAALSQVRVAGADYLSIQPYGGNPRVHEVLLEAGKAVLEGLDLSEVEPGVYEMCGLPLSLPSREAAPARVLLRPVSDSEMSVTR
jgi:arylformamidase